VPVFVSAGPQDGLVRKELDVAGGEVVGREVIVPTLLGASAALAGLTLVFLGVVLSTYRGFGAETPARVLERYRRPAMAVLASAAVCLATVLLAACWMLTRDNDVLYVSCVALFFAELVLLCGSAAYVMRRVMWR
jgi:hypothetical protein